MSKIVFLLVLLLSLDATANAADGSCAALLGASDSKTNLGSYLSELFKEGVVTEQELVEFREALIQGEFVNPIKNPELDIVRLVASERINDLLTQNLNFASILTETIQILNKDQSDATDRQEIIENITGDVFRIFTAKEGEFAELKKLIFTYFSKPESVKHHAALKRAIEITPPEELPLYSAFIFHHDHWVSHPELLRIVIEKTDPIYMPNFALNEFSKPHWAAHPELLRLVLKRSSENQIMNIASQVFSKEHWANHPELLRFAIEKAFIGSHVCAEYIFSKEHWANHPELLRLAIEKTNEAHQHLYAWHVFSKKFWLGHPELLRLSIANASIETYEARYSYSQFNWNGQSILEDASKILNQDARRLILREKLGSYPWEGTEQENLEEYLNKLYGRIDE